MKKENSPWIEEVIPDTQALSFFRKIKLALGVAMQAYQKLGQRKTQLQVHRLAVQRNDSFDDALERVVETGFSLLPTNSDRLDFVDKKNDTVKSVELAEPIVFKIHTKDGFVFYDWEGSKKQYSTYWLFRDRTQRIYSPLSFCVASAVHRSFINGDQRVPGDQYLPKEGGTIIEAGAYVGYKAVSLARRVGSEGQVLAIELAEKNYQLLQKNVVANDMQDRLSTLNCAVWNEDTELMLKGVSRMNHSVAVVDEKTLPEIQAVPARSLDSIIAEAGFEHVDYLNLQLNGAETEAIEGLQQAWGKVGYLNIITRFHKDGVLLVDIAREMLEERGAKIVVDSRCGHLYNLTAKLN